jgi:hypothetical protein
LNGIALAAVAPAKAGVASGIFNTARETGGCVGVALTSAVAGYSDALLVAAILTLGAAVLTLIALRPERLESYAAQAWPSEWSTEWEIASMKAPTICVGEVMW